ncbi:MAG: family 20 glycosylhydrolase [Clostridia bacterium]|nr:family 20 glycosylhydrolase [Clostridia bacterium]
MYITRLFADRSPIRYTYYKRGTSTFYPPNSRGEHTDGPWFDCESGNLFRGEYIIYGAYPMMDGGFDIAIELDKRYFIDHITLALAGGSETAGIDALDETGRLIARAPAEATVMGKPVTLSPGVFAERLTLRFHGACTHIGIAAIEIYAAADLEDTLYPIPTDIRYRKGRLPFSAIDGITAMTEEAAGAAAYLAERLSDELSLTVGTSGGCIGMAWAEREDDGFTLSVSEDGVKITAGTRRAFFYAAAALLQLATADGFRYAEINDTPMMEMRGVHLALPMRENIPFLYRLVRELFVPMRYNMVIIQLSGAMEYKCFPEINEAWQTACRKYEAGEWPKPAHYGSVGHDILTHEEVRGICDYIRSFGLDVIPEIQCFSHSQYITTAFPHLAEVPPTVSEGTADIDQKLADVPSNAFYPRDICPRHPEYYDYVFKIIDEVLEVVRPERFVHMGHDEVYEIGSCPRCAGHATEVYVEEVTRLHDYLEAKGYTMMIWSDMLHDGNDRYLVPEARKHLPRDILMLDFTWYFFLKDDIEDQLLPEGYRLMIGNMYSSHYPRYETRAKKAGMIGAQVSTWEACCESGYAYKGKMYDFVYTANMMWNPTYDSTYRLAYAELVHRILPDLRHRIGGIPRTPANRPCPIGGKAKNVPQELLYHSPARVALRLSEGNAEASVRVGRTAALLVITHATDRTSERPMWDPAIRIGEYVLVYADGSEHTVPLRYSENIHTYRHRYGTPMPSVYYRHHGYVATYSCFPIMGKDSEGRDYTLFRLPIVNPHPEKEISHILCRHAGNTDAEILIFDVKTT